MKSVNMSAGFRPRRWVLGNMVAFFMFWGTSAVLACRPGPGSDIFKSPEKNLEKQNFVFLGRLVPATASAVNTPITPRPGQYQRGQFLMVKQLKGVHVRSDIVFYSATHSCGFFHREGSVMLIFANKTPGETLILTALTPFRTFKTEAEGIKASEELLLKTQER